MGRRLVESERQAYEGARAFYLCFLPAVMAAMTALGLLRLGWGFVLYGVAMAATYLMGVVLYNKCHDNDPAYENVLRDQDSWAQPASGDGW